VNVLVLSLVHLLVLKLVVELDLELGDWMADKLGFLWVN